MSDTIIPAQPGWTCVLWYQDDALECRVVNRSDSPEAYYERVPVIAWRITARGAARPICPFQSWDEVTMIVGPDAVIYDEGLPVRATLDEYARTVRAEYLKRRETKKKLPAVSEEPDTA